mmetsp:Transcript_18672/g.47179  ORF Transcript_18672/g.47179 Transcript_18672/m.47179 type:complete len:89 (+) Transcript_18672:1416-1682(+)
MQERQRGDGSLHLLAASWWQRKGGGGAGRVDPSARIPPVCVGVCRVDLNISVIKCLFVVLLLLSSFLLFNRLCFVLIFFLCSLCFFGK